MIRTVHSCEVNFETLWLSLLELWLLGRDCGAMRVAVSFTVNSSRSLLKAGSERRPAYLSESWKVSLRTSPKAFMFTGASFVALLPVKVDVALAMSLEPLMPFIPCKAGWNRSTYSSKAGVVLHDRVLLHVFCVGNVAVSDRVRGLI